VKRAKHSAGLDQVRALSHPLRLRLLELFARSPITTKQAADTLGENPTKLYHHVAALEKAGLIRLRETRQNRGTTEKYFEAVANRLEASREAVSASTSQDRAAMGMVVFDQARNELVQALAAGLADGKQPLIATRAVLRMSPSAAAKVAGELTKLLQRIALGGERQAKVRSRAPLRRYSLTIALVPSVDES
jgi:DNA-binding transcriptional ArsR family regulator